MSHRHHHCHLRELATELVCGRGEGSAPLWAGTGSSWSLECGRLIFSGTRRGPSGSRNPCVWHRSRTKNFLVCLWPSWNPVSNRVLSTSQPWDVKNSLKHLWSSGTIRCPSGERDGSGVGAILPQLCFPDSSIAVSMLHFRKQPGSCRAYALWDRPEGNEPPENLTCPLPRPRPPPLFAGENPMLLTPVPQVPGLAKRAK